MKNIFRRKPVAGAAADPKGGVTLGRNVHYVLDREDCEAINRRRTNSKAIADRIAKDEWPIGAQAHIGDRVKPGEVCAAIVVKSFGPHYPVNLQVFLDGSDVFWAGARKEGKTQGTWHWPQITP